MATRIAAPLVRLGLLAAAFCAVSLAQTNLSIEEATRRTGPNLEPEHIGEEIVVRGAVATAPMRIMEYSHVPLVDKDGHGIMLEAMPRIVDDWTPGDVYEVRGTLDMRAGLPVLLPVHSQRLAKRTPPEPQQVKLRDLNSPGMLARLVTVDGRVASLGENSFGDTLALTDGSNLITISLPMAMQRKGPGLHTFSVGDKVRVTGVTSQYCPSPPYDRSYQIIISTASAVVLVEHIWLIPPQAIMVFIIAVLALAIVWYVRERRMARQREVMRGLNVLAEEIVASHSLHDIQYKLNQHLPELEQASSAQLFTYQPAKNQLEKLAEHEGEEPETLSIDAPENAVASLASLCFRNRTLLTIPDSRNSALLRAYDRSLLPRSMVFVPLMAQGDLLGVMQLIESERTRSLNPAEQTAMQHLGNQIAIAVRLQEQQSIREQLFRSEKLAAAGQLISGVASELRGPLQSISALTSHLLSDGSRGVIDRELQAIKTESARAAELVSRLVAFTKAEATEQKKMSLHKMLTGLIDLRSREWQSQGIRIKKLFDSASPFVLASQSQLEQVFLSLLVHAEQSLHQSSQRVITVATTTNAQAVCVVISYPGAPVAAEPAENGSSGFSLGLAVCRGIVQSQGGELRTSSNQEDQTRFDVELPLVDVPAIAERREGAAPRKSGRPLTILLLEPDSEVQQQLLNLFSVYRHRVVPMRNAGEARDVAQRLRFDLAFCALRLADASWVEVFDKIRGLVGAFVLLTDAYDPVLAQAVQDGEGFLLTKPVEETDLERLLAAVEQRLESRASAKPVR